MQELPNVTINRTVYRENNARDANVTNNQMNKEKTECEILREHREVSRERFTKVTKISNRTKKKNVRDTTKQ